MKKIITVTALAAGLVFASAGSASAEKPSCNWGQLTSEAIGGGFDQGGHASSFATPRLGLANVINRGDLNATCVVLS
jgi:hypothetical protein